MEINENVVEIMTNEALKLIVEDLNPEMKKLPIEELKRLLESPEVMEQIMERFTTMVNIDTYKLITEEI